MREHFPIHTRIAVPPGIGDTYWVIAKLNDFRRKNMIKHVTLCVKKNPLVRALDWSKMTGLVDRTEEYDFEPNKALMRYGYAKNYERVDCAMWPNAIIDRGQHLREWLPHYELDLDFDVHVAPGKRFIINEPFQIRLPASPVMTREIDTGDRHYVVYASSQGVNDNWFPNRGPEFWSKLLIEIAERTGKLPVLIGAGWDKKFAEDIDAPCINLIGHTSLPEIAGVIKRARLVVGMISGMTILANHFRTPSVAIYPDRFMPGFLSAWIKPNTPYIPIAQSYVDTPAELAKLAISISN